MKTETDWQPYVLKDYSFVRFDPGSTVLDLGCGDGKQMIALRAHGVRAFGVDPFRPALEVCRRHGLNVAQARSEQLPFADNSMDGVLCKVVIDYTEIQASFAELRRVLKPGAWTFMVYMGAGFYLRYVLVGRPWKYRVFGLRTLLNTWLYTLTGSRLPGFLGDTLYLSRNRLAASYRRDHFRLMSDEPAPTFFGFPVFMYHAIRKDPA